MEMTRSILKAMDVPNYLWGEAIRHSTYVINRVPTRALKNQTPYECLRNKKPNVEHLRVFGCLAHAKTETEHLRKLDDCSQPLDHLGIEPGTKAYRLYNPSTRKIIVSRDVIFNEMASWKWKGADRNEESAPGMFSVVWRDTINNGAGAFTTGQPQNNFNTENIDQQNQEEAENSDGDMEENPGNPNVETGAAPGGNPPQPEAELRRSSRQVSRPSYLSDYQVSFLADLECELLLASINEEPANFQEAKDSKEWTNACLEEIDSKT